MAYKDPKPEECVHVQNISMMHKNPVTTSEAMQLLAYLEATCEEL